MDTILTDRLYIDALRPQDHPFILELLNSPGWTKFIGQRNVRTLDEALEYINKVTQSSGVRYYVARISPNKIPVGIVTFIQRDYLDSPDIGFAFLPQYCRQGFAYEATTAVLNLLLKESKIVRVLAVTIPENGSSIRLLQKMDFSFENEIQIEKKTLHIYGVSMPSTRL